MHVFYLNITDERPELVVRMTCSMELLEYKLLSKSLLSTCVLSGYDCHIAVLISSLYYVATK